MARLQLIITLYEFLSFTNEMDDKIQRLLLLPVLLNMNHHWDVAAHFTLTSNSAIS